ncbi:MAG: hypothetical protein WBG46_05965 [Nonlabens sp.]
MKSRFGSGVKWNYLDKDSLVIYSNGTFHQIREFHYHEFSYSELKGDWSIENDTLVLKITEEKRGKTEAKWEPTSVNVIYKIKRNKIKLLGQPDYYRRKKLKLVQN